MSALKERYGIRKGSVGGESPSQAYLKQRKRSEPDAGPVAKDAGLYQPYGRQVAERQTKQPEVQDISQQDYMNRLLAAHSRVDELLKSRGLNSDDEQKYLRAWEKIPIIREEPRLRVRTPSNSSDSGLSTDNDSDRSNADQPEQSTDVDHVLAATEQGSSCETERTASPESAQSSFSCRAPVEAAVSTNCILSKKVPNLQASHSVRVPSRVKTKCAFSCKAPCATSQNRNLLLRKSPLHARCDKAVPQKNKSTATLTLQQPDRPKNVEKMSEQKQLEPDRPVPQQGEKKVQLVMRRRLVDKNTPPAVKQKEILASLKEKTPEKAKTTAEISVQHCSFYQKKKPEGHEAEPGEKFVRINLRLTERAPKKCAASIILPTCTRPQFARLDIVLPDKQPRRSLTLQLPKPKRQVGKLTRGMTGEVVAPKEERKINRLKIPEFFLQQSAETYEDIDGVRKGLKKIDNIVGGFVFQAKPPKQPLQRAGAIRRRPPPNKDVLSQLNIKQDVAAPFKDFIQYEEPPDDPKPPDPIGRRSIMSQTGHLNLPGSLDRTARTSGAATSKKSPIAELSETDRRLVEQYRRSLNIPQPSFLKRALSPLRCFANTIRKDEPLKLPTWIRRRSPDRLVLTRSPTPPPPRLTRAYRKLPRFSHRVHIFGIEVVLKKVDRTPRPKVRRRRLPKWIPRWRKKCSDEEVEEVEEEEVEEEVEESQQQEDEDEDDERSSRVKTRSFAEDDDEGMTEGEKAMLAAKRRHEEDQQAKLLDYEERRRVEREKEEEELRKLKEKQEKRRLEREQEEREQLEKRQADEEKRKREEEERKARIEEDRRKKEEEKNKRNQLAGGSFASLVNTGGSGGRNFTIPKKSDHMGDKFGNIVQAKQEMGMTKDQQEQAKKAFLAMVTKGIPDASGLLPADLKNKIKELHGRICKLEADKYDLEKRQERQEYDLKELNERQRQVARHAALKKGLDPTEAGSSKHPPKVQIVSKYDRQIDRRNFSERRSMYENHNAHPCFPGVPPPAVLLQKVILKFDNEQENENPEPSDEPDSPSVYHGSARPPQEWGRKQSAELDELSGISKSVFLTKIGNDDSASQQLIQPKPLQIPKIFAN